jgi:hypothetical protein
VPLHHSSLLGGTEVRPLRPADALGLRPVSPTGLPIRIAFKPVFPKLPPGAVMKSRIKIVNRAT